MSGMSMAIMSIMSFMIFQHIIFDKLDRHDIIAYLTDLTRFYISSHFGILISIFLLSNL